MIPILLPQLATRGVLLFIAASLVPSHLPAQRYGQWWWSGAASYGSYQSWPDVERRNERYESDSLGLSLGVHGYLGHPLIGAWDLGVHSESSSSGRGQSFDSDGLGYNANVSLFPRGGYPMSFSASRNTWDYRVPNEAVPPTFLSRQTTAQGQFRARTGRLRGLRLDFRNNEIEFDGDGEIEPQQFRDLTLRWGRGNPRFTTQFFARAETQDYGSFNASREAFRSQLDQNGTTPGGWRWFLTLDGSEETLGSRGTSATARDARGSWSTQGDVFERDVVDLGLNVAWSGASGGATSQGYGTGLTYRWRPSVNFEISPRGGVSRFEAGAETLTVTSGGLGLTLSKSFAHVESRLTLGADLRRSDSSIELRDDESRSYTATLSLRSAGDETRLRKTLDVTYTKNELSFERFEVGQSTEFPLVAALIDSQTGTRVRAGLSRSRGVSSASLWCEWSEQQVLFLGGELADSSSLQGSLNLSAARASLTLGAGDSEFESSSGPPLRFAYASAIASWTPWTVLRLQAVARQDEQESRILPPLLQRRYEARAEFGWGLLSWEVAAFQNEDRIGGGDPRVSRGLRWSVTRHFAGWLPIYSAIKRRGEIR